MGGDRKPGSWGSPCAASIALTPSQPWFVHDDRSVHGIPHAGSILGARRKRAGLHRVFPAPPGGRKLPRTAAHRRPVILDLGDGWSVADARRPERAPERVGSFVAGLTDGPVVVEHGGTARCLQVDLTPLGARRLLGRPMSEIANRVVESSSADLALSRRGRSGPQDGRAHRPLRAPGGARGRGSVGRLGPSRRGVLDSSIRPISPARSATSPL